MGPLAGTAGAGTGAAGGATGFGFGRGLTDAVALEDAASEAGIGT
jgi:hypothetical protein